MTSTEAPLPAAKVYAYQLADLTLRKVVTDDAGSFLFHELPAGLYQVITFKPGRAATRVMLQVHTQGKGVCGTFTREIAETKVAHVNEYARDRQHPLLCTMEYA